MHDCFRKLARTGRRLWRGALLFILVLGLAGFAGWELGVRRAQLPEELSRPAPATPILADRHGRLLAVDSTGSARDSRPLPLSAMGPWLPQMTVGIEDHRFSNHHGVDPIALGGAAWRNLRHGRVLSGASTITQQLIKICSPRRPRTLAAKVKEALAASQLERRWSKDRILEAYMNRLDYGNRRIGPEAAAQAYFGKAAAELTLPEAIFLAGLPQSPTRLNPWTHPAEARARYLRNVRHLARCRALPDSAAGMVEGLAASPPRIRQVPPPNLARHFSAMLRDDLAAGGTRLGRLGRLGRPGPRPVSTMLDLSLQEAVERLAEEHLAAVSGQGVGDVAVVVLENASGAVRALVSAGPEKHADLNAAIIPRSCGSTLKPFLYLSAIEKKILSGASLLPDTPDAVMTNYRDYDPQNFSQRFHGPVRVREALGNSMNVPAVVTVAKLGARETFSELRGWGLEFPGSFDSYGAGFILGNAPVRLLDLAAAYAGLARGGLVWRARLWSGDAIESRVTASPEACAIISDMLCDNGARKKSFGSASPLHLGPRVAVKTGTSSGFRDGWCVGFNGRHTVAVWAGNLDGRAMGGLLSVHSAAPLWAAVMQTLLAAGDPPVPEPRPSGSLQRVEVAAETGLLPRPGEATVGEWFLPGTAPTASAADFYENDILMLPREYSAWCAGPHNHLGAKVRSEGLEILFPQDGAVFLFNPRLPEGQQILPLQATVEDCKWTLNGQPLASASLRLERGEWQLTASSRQGEARVKFLVE